MYLVWLDNCGNPDHEENPNKRIDSAYGFQACETMLECRQAVRDYIDKLELGSGNWAGGKVIDSVSKKQVATISYNGRAWKYPEDTEWSE